MGTACTVIILTRGSQERYNIRHTIVVNATKIIIGHPLDLPVLNATNRIQRLFDGACDGVGTVAAVGRREGEQWEKICRKGEDSRSFLPSYPNPSFD